MDGKNIGLTTYYLENNRLKIIMEGTDPEFITPARIEVTNLRFYVIAFLFLIFDVEVAFMFPVASIFKQWTQAGFGQGWLAFIEVAIFVGILLVGFAYAWHKGDLNWVRPKKKE